MLRNMGMQDVTTILGANTPIVKFKHRSQQCHINVNDLGGWYVRGNLVKTNYLRLGTTLPLSSTIVVFLPMCFLP